MDSITIGVFLISIVLVCLLSCILIILWDIRKISLRECYECYIAEFEYIGHSSNHLYHIYRAYVRTYIDDEEIIVPLRENFWRFFNNEWQLNALYDKYQNAELHVYIDLYEPYKAGITREFCWKRFLAFGVCCLFLIFILLILLRNFFINF